MGFGRASADVFSEIGNLTGPAADRPGIPPRPGPMTPEKVSDRNRMTAQTIANEIGRQRQSLGDDRTVDMLAVQADTQLPDFRKR